MDEDGLTSVRNLYIAGDGRRIGGADAAEAAGALAAFAALIELRYPVTMGTHKFWQTRAGYGRTFRRALQAAFPPPVDIAAEAPDEAVVCACEGVTAGTLREAAGRLGTEAKAECGIGGGRCQGCYCAVAADEILAAALDIQPQAVGRTRLRAPRAHDMDIP